MHAPLPFALELAFEPKAESEQLGGRLISTNFDALLQTAQAGFDAR